MICPPPAHPGIAVEAAAPYPGVGVYAPHWGAPAGYLTQAHNEGWAVIGVHGLADPLDWMAGYDQVTLDEPMWQGQTAAEVMATLAAVRLLAPGAAVGVVEPYAAQIDALLEAGGRPDFVSGEAYTGGVSLAELNGWAWAYGVGTQMWATGADTVMGWEGRVDLVVAADLGGSWGGPSYGAELYTRLGFTCRLALPMVSGMPSAAYP